MKKFSLTNERFKLFEDIEGFQSSEVSIKNRRIYIDHFEEIPVRKVREDSSRQKTFCISIGGGVPIYERGSKLLADLNHLPITFQLLKKYRLW